MLGVALAGVGLRGARVAALLLLGARVAGRRAIGGRGRGRTAARVAGRGLLDVVVALGLALLEAGGGVALGEAAAAAAVRVWVCGQARQRAATPDHASLDSAARACRTCCGCSA